MGENWLWDILRDKIETLSASNLKERTDPEWRTKLLRSIRNAVIDQEEKVELAAVNRSLSSIGDAPARFGMITLLQKYAKESGAEWAKEALDNFEMESTVAQRTPAQNGSIGGRRIRLLNDVEELEETYQKMTGSDSIPEYLKAFKKQLENAIRPPVALSSRPVTAPSRVKAGADSKWLMKRFEEQLSGIIDEGTHKLNEPRLRGLKRISLALNDGSFDRDYGSPLYDDYILLERVLRDAYLQASEGKGKERHANGLPFDQQKIFTIARQVGDGYVLGQAMKKLAESQGMPNPADAHREILGAIVYAAAAAALRAERMPAPEDDEDPFEEDL